jgi:competence protein ComEC
MGTRKSLTTQNDVNTYEINLGDGAKLTCLAANGFVRNRSSKVANVNTENEKSLCFLLRYKKFDYLTGGDTIGRSHGSENTKVEKAIGEYISTNGINVDMLHVNHHGANNGSAEDFLELTKPEIAIISLGNDNTHHHPNVNALKRLVASGVYRIYQTSWGTTTGSMPAEVRRRQAIFQQDVIVTSDGSS